MFVFDSYNIITLIQNIKEYNRQIKQRKILNSDYNNK